MFKPEEYVSYKDSLLLRDEDLSKGQIRILQDLNVKLVNIENNIKKEVQSLIFYGEQRINNPNDWINNYEIDCYITFILREDDPEYDKYNDNVLVQLWEGSKHEIWEWGIGDGNNHNEYQNWDKHPMKNEYHCWLYHCLYDHTELGWINMLRIGRIWVDINVVYQKIIEE